MDGIQRIEYNRGEGWILVYEEGTDIDSLEQLQKSIENMLGVNILVVPRSLIDKISIDRFHERARKAVKKVGNGV